MVLQHVSNVQCIFEKPQLLHRPVNRGLPIRGKDSTENRTAAQSMRKMCELKDVKKECKYVSRASVEPKQKMLWG